MSGRIVLLEGALDEQEVDAVVEAAAGDAVGEAAPARADGGPGRLRIRAVLAPPGGEASEEGLRAAMAASLDCAAARGCETLAAPALGAGGALTLQRRAEILLEAARAHLAGDGAGQAPLREIRFVLSGEPAYRVFEMVDDSIRVAEQMARLRSRGT